MEVAESNQEGDLVSNNALTLKNGNDDIQFNSNNSVNLKMVDILELKIRNRFNCLANEDIEVFEIGVECVDDPMEIAGSNQEGDLVSNNVLTLKNENDDMQFNSDNTVNLKMVDDFFGLCLNNGSSAIIEDKVNIQKGVAFDRFLSSLSAVKFDEIMDCEVNKNLEYCLENVSNAVHYDTAISETKNDDVMGFDRFNLIVESIDVDLDFSTVMDLKCCDDEAHHYSDMHDNVNVVGDFVGLRLEEKMS